MNKQMRNKKILTMLLDDEDFLTSTEIAEKLNVSQRTIFNNLNSKEFKDMLFGAKIERIPNQGIKLLASEEQLKKISYNLYDNEYPMPDRYYFSDIESILIYFLKNKGKFVSRNTLSEYLFTDINSVDRRVIQTNNYINNDKVSIISKSGVGLVLEGSEKSIRAVFRKLLAEKVNYNDVAQNDISRERIPDSLLQYLELVFSPKVVNAVVETVNISELNLNEIYTNYDYDMLVIKLCIQVLRIQNGHRLERSLAYDENNREYLIALLMATRFNNEFNITMEYAEVCSITEDIISTRRIDYNTQQGVLDQDNIATEFINLVSAGLGMDLSKDEELRINLMKHLVPAIHRMKHGIQVENPILKHVKYEYTQEYIVVMTCIGQIEKMANIKFDPNELGYICLHVVAAVNRSNNVNKIKTILICDSGLAVSSYLSSRIEHQFKDIDIINTISTNDVEHYDLRMEQFVINSTHKSFEGLSEDNYVSISPMFSKSDQSVLREWFVTHRYATLLKSESNIEENTFFFKDDLQSKEEVITRYSRLLEIDQFVKKEFSNSCIEREKTLPTTIGRGIALPHGDEAYVLKSATVIIQLKEPILWDDQKVDLVFLLAIDPSDIEEFRSLIERINRIVTNENTLNVLKSANHSIEIKKLLFDLKEE